MGGFSGPLIHCPVVIFVMYCRFYQGRRSSDDTRQIERWLSGHGPKGRFRLQLINKIAKANKSFDDTSVSPVIRQTCQHWGYKLTQFDYDLHVKSKQITSTKREDHDDQDDETPRPKRSKKKE
eukprot:c7457_g1_i2.p2 GENE.c7457_g1_i2~~c7457_g1_i2.p2  ORF type:complete len:123 (-),score=27.78 c7457_g1_i2:68-436(-)